jgi:biopolymer transport protein ExbD
MNLKTRNKLDIDFETSSLTDIVFLLLIFFMLSATYKVHDSIQVNLPASDSRNAADDFVSVVITKELGYYVGDEVVQFDNIKEVLDKKMTSSKHVLIEADECVPISCVIKVSDLVMSLGGKLSIATKRVEVAN